MTKPTPGEIDTMPKDDRLVVSSNPLSKVWKDGAEVEAAVFIGSGYVGSPDELYEEYRPYEPFTSMVTAYREGNAAGSVRIIEYSEVAGFKTLHDAQSRKLVIDENGKKRLDDINPENIIEIGTISISPEWRNMPGANLGLNIELYGAIFGIGNQKNAPFIIASFDERYFNRFARFFGEDVYALGPAVDFMGSPTLPVLMDMRSTFKNIQETNPDLQRVLESSIQKLEYEDRPTDPMS